MSKRIIIVVEGDTEEEFVKSSLQPYFGKCGVHDVRGIKITTSPGHKGGIGSYGKFKRNVEIYLKNGKLKLISETTCIWPIRCGAPTTFITENLPPPGGAEHRLHLYHWAAVYKCGRCSAPPGGRAYIIINVAAPLGLW